MVGDTLPQITGDTLTYSVDSIGNPDIVETEINGSLLTLVPLTIGETTIEILASAGFTEKLVSFEVNIVYVPPPPQVEQNLLNPVIFTISPNPFTNEITIMYEIPRKSKTSLEIYNYFGQLVSILVDEIKQQGKHKIQLDGKELPAGIYFCVLKTNEGIQTRKIVKL
jgi:hypothetical protein